MHEHGEHMMGHEHGMGLMGALMGASSLLMLLLALAALGHLLYRKGLLPGLRGRLATSATPAVTSGRSEAEAWLDMALAKGEISVDDYHERRSALRTADL